LSSNTISFFTKVFEGIMTSWKKIKSIFVWCKENSEILVAVATFILAILTYGHIRTTNNMAMETKRLADISIEQFKIKSYPTFLIESDVVSVEADKFIQIFKIHNKGELTAYQVTFHIINAYKKGNGLIFVSEQRPFYESDENMTTLNFERDIWRQSSVKITTKNESTKDFNINSLTNCILFIKYKVPYDLKYRFKIKAFALKNDIEKNEHYIWQEISEPECNTLVNRALKQKTKWNDLVKVFFEDFEVESIN